MTFAQLFKQFHNTKDPINLFSQLLITNKGSKYSRDHVDGAWLALISEFRSKKKGRSLSAMRALLIMIGSEKFITRIQREGNFRASRYAFDSIGVKAVVDDMLKNSAAYGLQEIHVDYLRSISSLWSLAADLAIHRDSLVARMRQERQCVIKTLLANIDVMFARGVVADRLADTDSAYSYSSEIMAEAFSYLLSLFNAEIGLANEHFQLVDESAVYSPFYEGLLVDAAKMCAYLEVEVLIDAFPYKAEISRDGSVHVSARDANLEKSIRIGYVQSDMQKQIRLGAVASEISNESSAVQSVTRFAYELFTRIGQRIVTYEPSPYPRYVAAWPMSDLIFSPFSGNGLFLEDLSSLEMLGTEDYVKAGEIVDSPVVGSITVIDILKIQRFFHFLRFGIQMAIDGHSPTFERAGLQLSSCLPVFKKENLVALVGFLIGKDKSESILNALTCDFSSDYVDLQYTPFIRSGNWYMVSLAVFTSSNLVRNLLCHNAKRLTLRNQQGKDPMQEALKDALSKAGFLVADEVEMGPRSNPLEVDLIALKNNQLFLFECKNSFHPCNVYEMRTSYGHITHAAEQLTKRVAWLQDVANQNRLLDKLKWAASQPLTVRTCIAIGNRVFNGYACEGHPVRQVHELLNILNGGYIRIHGTARRIWNGTEFSTEDLVQHLEGTTVIADFMRSTQPIARGYVFGQSKLNLSSYVLDTDQLTTIAAERYPEHEPAL